MVASDASDHNFFRRLICLKTTVVRTCSSPITGAATSSPPCSTSSPWRGSPVSTRGSGPPEALTRVSARKEIKAKRRRSHHLAALGLGFRIRQPVTGDHGRQHPSLASQTPDGVFGTHTSLEALVTPLRRASRAHPPPRCQRSMPAKPATCSISTRM